ncbi:class I SAM-dependent methyltransferase [Paraconexibacter algicola]|uniref:class I SAM-dependent methyltransferase n=1 Tax=Paraconexibacter algicola TaxID=2133960 RepID=UPI001304ADBC|nr:class I SAM-dependent methyltransferase [Paraconexibacter algicola]
MSQSHAPAAHYDRVTAAWRYLLGEELHYGVFDEGVTDLAVATGELTRRMIEGGRIEQGVSILDVGCGTGAPACRLAQEFGAHVTGITTSEEGIRAAQERAKAAGLAAQTSFELRDGTDNGLPDASFDRVWILESSHLMRRRERLIGEAARVLKPGGRVVLCDITRQRPLDLAEVRRLREPLALLREVFGDARMEGLGDYRALMEGEGLTVDHEVDLTAATRPTFDAWQANADRYRTEVVELIGERAWTAFRDSCDVLAGFWDDGTLGYGLIAASRP